MFVLQQQQQLLQTMSPDGKEMGFFANEREKAQWGWNWLERWMSSQPYHARHLGANEPSYMTLTTTTTTTDDMSEKTVEMDVVTPPGKSNINMGLLETTPYTSQQERQSSSNNVPSYMAPTQSAKAKVRGQGSLKQRGPYLPQWNPSTKKGSNIVGSGCDSSSSGGGTAMYQAPRSPSLKNNGMRLHSRRLAAGYSPDCNGGHIDSHGWRNDFG